jgi:hypothetical protein
VAVGADYWHNFVAGDLLAIRQLRVTDRKDIRSSNSNFEGMGSVVV